MAAGSIAEEFTMAVPAELLWKETFSHDAATLKKTFAGLVNDVEIKGDGGPGSLVTMKFNPAVVGEAMVLKSRLVAQDHEARVVSWDGVVVEGGEVEATQFKNQVVEVTVVPAGENACVVKVTVEYDLHSDAPLSMEDEAKLMKDYVRLIKHAEENIVGTRPAGEFA